MLKFKLGKKADIKFGRDSRGEAGEMLAVVINLEKDAALFVAIPADVKEAAALRSRLHGRLGIWRKAGRIPSEVTMRRTRDNQYAIFHGDGGKK